MFRSVTTNVHPAHAPTEKQYGGRRVGIHFVAKKSLFMITYASLPVVNCFVCRTMKTACLQNKETCLRG